MTITVAAQIVAFVAYMFCAFGFQQKEQKKILVLFSVYNFLIMIQYFMLGGIMGAIGMIINIVRNLVYYYLDVKKKKNGLTYLLIFWAVAFLLTGLMSKNIKLDIFPLVTSLLVTYAMWSGKPKVVRIIGLFVSIGYIVYAIKTKAYVVVIFETIIIISALVGIIRLDLKKKTKEQSIKNKE